jgi:hypothetical protein
VGMRQSNSVCWATRVALLSITACTMNAALVTVGTNFGPNTGLLDTATNLVWLDLTVTNGQSFDYVNSQLGPGGVYSGWQWATADQNACGSSQLTVLFEHEFGGCGTSSDPTAILAMMNLLGGPLENSPTYIQSEGFTNLTYPYASGWASINGGLVEEPTVSYYVATPALWGAGVASMGFQGTGAWLVQSAAPEPTGVWLMGAGCLALLVFQKRRGARNSA